MDARWLSSGASVCTAKVTCFRQRWKEETHTVVRGERRSDAHRSIGQPAASEGTSMCEGECRRGTPGGEPRLPRGRRRQQGVGGGPSRGSGLPSRARGRQPPPRLRGLRLARPPPRAGSALSRRGGPLLKAHPRGGRSPTPRSAYPDPPGSESQRSPGPGTQARSGPRPSPCRGSGRGRAGEGTAREGGGSRRPRRSREREAGQ